MKLISYVIKTIAICTGGLVINGNLIDLRQVNYKISDSVSGF